MPLAVRACWRAGMLAGCTAGVGGASVQACGIYTRRRKFWCAVESFGQQARAAASLAAQQPLAATCLEVRQEGDGVIGRDVRRQRAQRVQVLGHEGARACVDECARRWLGMTEHGKWAPCATIVPMCVCTHTHAQPRRHPRNSRRTRAPSRSGAPATPPTATLAPAAAAPRRPRRGAAGACRARPAAQGAALRGRRCHRRRHRRRRCRCCWGRGRLLRGRGPLGLRRSCRRWGGARGGRRLLFHAVLSTGLCKVLRRSSRRWGGRAGRAWVVPCRFGVVHASGWWGASRKACVGAHWTAQHTKACCRLRHSATRLRKPKKQVRPASHAPVDLVGPLELFDEGLHDLQQQQQHGA